MKVAIDRMHLLKKHPLRLSRGLVTGSTNLLVSIEWGGSVGLGEAAPNGVSGGSHQQVEAAMRELELQLLHVELEDEQQVMDVLARCDNTPARAAFDMAILDVRGRSSGASARELLGVGGVPVPGAITIGIDDPQVIADRVRSVCEEYSPRVVKLKLGAPAGLNADLAALEAARSNLPAEAKIGIDVNGGWTLAAALEALDALVEAGVSFLEQPLSTTADDDLRELRRVAGGLLPIYLDESVHCAEDVDRVSEMCDGVNLKLMKSGGIREGVRLIERARAHGLDVMIGCMGESSLSIGAASHIAPLADLTDLDSNLNLEVDPFVGPTWVDGCVVAPAGPGLGVERR